MSKIVIVGGARDYHAMDWYRSIQRLSPDREIDFLTDLLGREGYDKIIKSTDRIKKLFIIDKFLFTKQSKFSNKWRNLFKLLVLPVQILLLRKYSHKNPDAIYHAHPMYYMFLCRLAGVEYVGTPQGSEILVRPHNSFLYKKFAIYSLLRAKFVTVDSINMQNEILKLCGVKAKVIQFGVDTKSLMEMDNVDKTKITSIRGMTSLYRIKEIVESRNKMNTDKSINLVYPFEDKDYHNEVNNLLLANDNDLGRMSKKEMLTLYSESFLVISIPKSDSSPRSVYEAIFLGCVVATTYNTWIDILPECMIKRIITIDLEDKNWFNKAVDYANKLKYEKYIPSEEALDLFDQDRSMLKAIEVLY